jgi:amino acid transporter
LPNAIGPVLDQLAGMYRPVLGSRLAQWFIVIGAFAVLYSTLFAATAGNSRLLADAARTAHLVPAHDPVRFRNAVRWGCILLPLISFALFVVFKDPVGMVTVGGIMQAISLPLIAAGAVFLRYFRTDARIRPGRLWDLGLWLSLAGLCLAAAQSLLKGWDELTRLFSR